MSFTSLHFAIFFPVVTILYFVLPFRLRWVWLLLASYYFYMSWAPWYVLLILYVTAVSYVAGIVIERTATRFARRGTLAFACANLLLVLFVFKYFNFFNEQTALFLTEHGIAYKAAPLNVLLPVGISFFTFQVISYLADVYRREMQAERHLGLFALYVVLYPQLVAGPIERGVRLLPQLRQLLNKSAPESLLFDEARATDGLRLILRGLVKKLVVADNLALFVDQVYNDPSRFGGLAMANATVLFGLQIYFDFSAYTDIARGAARAMGIDLMENFRRPYLARSVPEFWRRWHISLTSWFRDYVYIPLGGNRVSRGRWYFNIFTVFLLSGLWHGANWTFLVWGCLHGLYYLLSHATQGVRAALRRITGIDRFPPLLAAWQIVATFLLVSFAWIFFRASDISTAFAIVESVFRALYQGIFELPISFLTNDSGFAALAGGVAKGMTKFDGTRYWLTISVTAGFAAWELTTEQRAVSFAAFWTPLRWLGYYAGAVSILLLGQIGAKQFIYFQF